MNRILLPILLLVACPCPLQAAQLSLSKSSHHYAEEMEYYYQKPRAEMLPDMLKSFSSAHILDNAEKRLFVAAFLAALIQTNRISLATLSHGAQTPSIQQTLDLALYLADPASLPNAPVQFKNLPAPLQSWNPAWEKAALDLHWAAFMATGADRWLDRIITCAIGYAHGVKGSSQAAASLYDYAPRHPAIVRRLEAFLPGLKESEQQVLKTILAHASS